MSDDLELANLLGEAPAQTPDPGFRYDVFARVTERARRRGARARAFRQVAALTLIGALFPILQAFGLTITAAQPVLLALGALAGAGAAAALTIYGPRLVLARSRALLKAPLARV